MKSAIKRMCKPLWKATLPIRRPLANRFELYLRRNLTLPPINDLAEVNVALDHVVRELVRLQDQVDLLREAVEDLREERASRHPKLSAPAA